LWDTQGFAGQRVDAGRHQQVEVDGEMVIDAERSLRAKDVIGLKVTMAFKGFSGLFHWTVRRIAEVKIRIKLPVIYLVCFEADQSEVRLNSQDEHKILEN
jgi:hypothetical protein